MSNSRNFRNGYNNNKGALATEIPETTMWKDFLALIKIGIVNSNLITTFTGLWLALHFSDKGFFENLDILFFTIIGSALIMAGSCALITILTGISITLMERTKTRPTVTGKVKPNKSCNNGDFVYFNRITLFIVNNHYSSRHWYHWCF